MPWVCFIHNNKLLQNVVLNLKFRFTERHNKSYKGNKSSFIDTCLALSARYIICFIYLPLQYKNQVKFNLLA